MTTFYLVFSFTSLHYKGGAGECEKIMRLAMVFLIKMRMVCGGVSLIRRRIVGGWVYGLVE
jgi:hypothetical protein